MQISKKDVLWNYAATFLKIAASVLLLPIILRKMPSEMVAFWSVFMTITAFSNLLDFGFSPSFTRNVTYIFSGVKSLKKSGFEIVNNQDLSIDFGLLKEVISAMRWIYLRIAFILFVILSTIGTYYIHTLLKLYTGSHQDVYIAWGILCLINTYNLYTLYYDALLQGKGLIKRSKQIIIVGQLIYLLIATILIFLGYGLIAIVSAQAASVIIIRTLSHKAFFSNELKTNLNNFEKKSSKKVMEAILPNSLKIGITSIGSFMVQRSALVIGSLYLTLDQVASYGITMQLLAVLSGFSAIFIGTYQPKIVQLQVKQDTSSIKKLYIKGQIILFLTYALGGLVILYLGDSVFNLMHSQTKLLTFGLTAFALILSYEETVLMVSGGILLTKNEVPFFKSAIISGLFIVAGLLLAYHFFEAGVLAMILVPFIVDISYQTWKWPYEVHKELHIATKDMLWGIKNLTKKIEC